MDISRQKINKTAYLEDYRRTADDLLDESRRRGEWLLAEAARRGVAVHLEWAGAFCRAGGKSLLLSTDEEYVTCGRCQRKIGREDVPEH